MNNLVPQGVNSATVNSVGRVERREMIGSKADHDVILLYVDQLYVLPI